MLTLPNHPLPHSHTQPAAPDLSERVAQCVYCGKEEPSSDTLGYFIYRGKGSTEAIDGCGNCGYRFAAHEKTMMAKNVPSNRLTVVEQGRCPGFTPRGGLAMDEYYCGCRGFE